LYKDRRTKSATENVVFYWISLLYTIYAIKYHTHAVLEGLDIYPCKRKCALGNLDKIVVSGIKICRNVLTKQLFKFVLSEFWFRVSSGIVESKSCKIVIFKAFFFVLLRDHHSITVAFISSMNQRKCLKLHGPDVTLQWSWIMLHSKMKHPKAKMHFQKDTFLQLFFPIFQFKVNHHLVNIFMQILIPICQYFALNIFTKLSCYQVHTFIFNLQLSIFEI
jgi:hypothetical protein